jgi:hypothetical protein
MRQIWSLIFALSLAACEPAPPADVAAAPEVPQAAPKASQTTPPDSGVLIRHDGMGVAKAGMKIGELRAALPAGTTLGAAEAFMVDVQGLPVVRGADTLFYVLAVTGEPVGDDAPITLLATRNPAFRTAEGIGPGTTLAEAAARYGAPTLSYSTADESREYAAFARYPHQNVRFRVGAGDGTAGVYSTEEEYNETTKFDGSARISQVMIDLQGPRG